jgi:hypothetical protein
MSTEVDENATISSDIDSPTGDYINSNESCPFKMFTFKHVGGCHQSRHEVNIDGTMEEFLRIIKYLIAVECELCENPQAIDDNVLNRIDIIEAGQFHNINGRDAELAPPLEPSNKLFKYYFEKRINTTAFYIRIRNN